MGEDERDGDQSEASSEVEPELVARSPADSMITAAHSMVTPRVELEGTGFHKPLPARRRIERSVTALGLLLGRQLTSTLRDDHIILIMMAAVVGVTSGAAAALLLLWIESANELFILGATGILQWVLVLGVPVIGGLAAGGIRWLTARYLHEVPVISPVGVIGAVAHRDGALNGRAGVMSGLGTGVSIGSGASCGHEGPSVAIGATVGSVLAEFFGFRLRRKVAMVGAGCAGGLAAAFNAPLAGVIFTVELVFGGAIGGNVGTMSVFIPLIVAAVAGTFTSHAIFGAHTEFQLPEHEYAALPEYGFYILLAVAAGVIGALFARAITFANERFAKLEKIPAWLRPAIGALGVGLLALVFSTQVLGAGRGIVDQALHGQLAWEVALMLLGIKLVATAITLGSGGFGGAFMPSLYVGSCLGTLIAVLASGVLGGEAQSSGAYALVGMGAVFAGMMQAPLTPIVMVFELTHDYGIILPLMLACILAVVVSRRLNEGGLYRLVGQQRGIVLQTEAEGEVMKRGFVRDLMAPAEQVLTLGAELEEIRQVSLRAKLQAIYVVNDEGHVVGYINGDQLAQRMLQGEIVAGARAEDLMGTARLTPLLPTDTLAGAMAAFSRAAREVLPVVDDEQRLVGVLRRESLLAHYTDKVLGEQQEVVQVHAGQKGTVDQEVGLGKGVVLERVVVGRRWAGKSLAELELRNKAGVVVLEWRREDELIKIDPKAPLREGDVLAIAGSRRAIMRAREIW